MGIFLGGVGEGIQQEGRVLDEESSSADFVKVLYSMLQGIHKTGGFILKKKYSTKPNSAASDKQLCCFLGSIAALRAYRVINSMFLSFFTKTGKIGNLRLWAKRDRRGLRGGG